MKNKKLLMGLLGMVLAFGVMVVGCDDSNNNGSTGSENGETDDGTDSENEVTVQGNNLAEKLAWLRGNAKSNTNYLVTLSAMETTSSPARIIDMETYNGATNVTITLKSTIPETVIQLNEIANTGSLFTIKSGFTLVLGENIVLKGLPRGADGWPIYICNSALVSVDAGSLVMKSNAKITQHATSSSSSRGGGVFVNSGTFTMNENASIVDNYSFGDGGGVYVNSGSFTMNENASIKSNRSSGGAGVHVNSGSFTMNDNASIKDGTGSSSGVYVSSGNFTMNGNAIISGYTSYNHGGGVHVSSGSFLMTGNAKISGNTCICRTSGVLTDNSFGGGVYVRGGTFIKTGGIIYGYDADDPLNSNVVKWENGGALSGKGHAVYISDYADVSISRTDTVGTHLEKTISYSHSLKVTYDTTATPVQVFENKETDWVDW
jgi:hypothetical protein